MQTGLYPSIHPSVHHRECVEGSHRSSGCMQPGSSSECVTAPKGGSSVHPRNSRVLLRTRLVRACLVEDSASPLPNTANTDQEDDQKRRISLLSQSQHAKQQQQSEGAPRGHRHVLCRAGSGTPRAEFSASPGLGARVRCLRRLVSNFLRSGLDWIGLDCPPRFRLICESICICDYLTAAHSRQHARPSPVRLS